MLSITASAAGLTKSVFKAHPAFFDLSNSVVAKKIDGKKNIRNSKPAKAAPAVEDILGEYVWSYYMYLQGNSGDYQMKVSLDMTEAGDSLVLNLGGWEIKGTYDASSGILSFPSNQFLEYNAQNTIDVFFYHNRWNDDGQGNNFLDTPFEMLADGETITTDDYDNIVVGSKGYGYFIFAGDNYFEKVHPIDMDEGWEEIGTGTFYDGWILSRYGFSLADVENEENGLAVEDVVLEYNEALNLYRLNNPYQVGGSIFDMEFEDGGRINEAEDPGYIVFDLSDPSFVTVYPNIYSGYSDDDTDYYNFNAEGLLVVEFGYSTDWVLSNLSTLGLENISSLDSETGKLTFYNCMFGTQDDTAAGYGWQLKDGTPVEMISVFVSDALKGLGVKNVEASDANALKEYFNLQGQRVANPEKGIYILRQGGEAKKILVK